MNLHARLHLALTHGLSPRQRITLLTAFGGAEQALAAPRRALIALIGETAADLLLKGPATADFEKALQWAERPHHYVLAKGEAGYPPMLEEIADAPCFLYVSGRVELLEHRALAIVGSRNATPQGVRDAEAFAEALSHADITIVSGLALGIDAAAHRGGLRARGSSIAIVGTGVDVKYPESNSQLFEALENAGAIVSEFPLGTPPSKGNFPRRNRIISGLSRGVLVVEAAESSGSLITAHCAVEQNRDVFAIPGSIHTPLSKGCHKLIKEGAKLVECAHDILDELPPNDLLILDRTGDPLLDAMGGSPISVDEIVERTGETAARIASRLTRLELEGQIAAIAGGLFQRVPCEKRPQTRVIE